MHSFGTAFGAGLSDSIRGGLRLLGCFDTGVLRQQHPFRGAGFHRSFYRIDHFFARIHLRLVVVPPSLQYALPKDVDCCAAELENSAHDGICFNSCSALTVRGDC